MNAVTGTFFLLPTETKAKYTRKYATNGNSNGWIGLGIERSGICAYTIAVYFLMYEHNTLYLISCSSVDCS